MRMYCMSIHTDAAANEIKLGHLMCISYQLGEMCPIWGADENRLLTVNIWINIFTLSGFF